MVGDEGQIAMQTSLQVQYAPIPVAALVHNILSGFFITLPLFTHVLLSNVIIECIRRRHKAPAEQSQIPQRLKVLRSKRKMLVEPSIRISLQSSVDSVASGTLDNCSANSAIFSQPIRDVAKKSSRETAQTVHKLELSECSHRHKEGSQTSLTQKSSATSQEVTGEYGKEVYKSDNKIDVKEMEESGALEGNTLEARKETKRKIPTLDEILDAGHPRSTPAKKKMRNMVDQDDRLKKEAVQSMGNEIRASQTAQKLSPKDSICLPNTKKYMKAITAITEVEYKEDKTEKTEGTLVSDRTQHFSGECTLSTEEQSNDSLKSGGDETVSKQTEEVDEDDMQKLPAIISSKKANTSSRTKTAEGTRMESTRLTLQKGTSSSGKDGTCPESTDGSRVSSHESTETTHTSLTGHRPDSTGTLSSHDSLGLENTQSSRRTVQMLTRGNFKTKPVAEPKARSQEPRSDNIRPWVRQQQKASVAETQSTQRSQQDSSSSTLRRNFAGTRRLNIRKLNLTDSTEEDSRSRNVRMPPRRIPIKVHPDRLRIPFKRGTHNRSSKPLTGSKRTQK